jgi:hypothetical protein
MKKSDMQKGHYYVGKTEFVRRVLDIYYDDGPTGLSGMMRLVVGTASSSPSPSGHAGKSRRRTLGSITWRWSEHLPAPELRSLATAVAATRIHCALGRA